MVSAGNRSAVPIHINRETLHALNPFGVAWQLALPCSFGSEHYSHLVIHCPAVRLQAYGLNTRLLAVSRHNHSVHAGCSCGHLGPSSPWQTFLYRLRVCNFHTGILTCVVDNGFLNNFLTNLRRHSGFFFIFRNCSFTISFLVYHGDQIISRASWRIFIWRSISIQYVQM